MRHWASLEREVLQRGKKGYRVKLDDLGLNSEGLAAVKRKLSDDVEVVIARIDRDGYWVSEFGPIADAPVIPVEQFMKRGRFELSIVVVDGYVGVQKDYRGDKVSFVHELNALDKLGEAGCNVPVVLAVDTVRLRLTLSYIQGSVLREELVKKGARIRDLDIERNDDVVKLNAQDKALWATLEGRRYLSEVITEEQIDELFLQLQRIHQCGIIVHDIKFGNIIVEKSSGQFYWIDFDYSRDFSGAGRNVSRFLRDRDIEKFNLHFGTEKLTYRSIRRLIKEKNDPILHNWYAPVYLGAGLRIGSVWDCNLGYGRWHYLLKRWLPDFAGKRVLDLGANNGANGLQLLRHGAREVVGVELEQHHIMQGRFVKAAMEWADNEVYAFGYYQGSMAKVPEWELGRFDMVMAMCSIYYLDDDGIAGLIGYLSGVTEVLVLQCNVSKTVDRADPHVRVKSSTAYLVEAMKANGFGEVEVIAPLGYTRPLAIGRKGK